jgi:hypothetical protein
MNPKGFAQPARSRPSAFRSPVHHRRTAGLSPDDRHDEEFLLRVSGIRAVGRTERVGRLVLKKVLPPPLGVAGYLNENAGPAAFEWR